MVLCTVTHNDASQKPHLCWRWTVISSEGGSCRLCSSWRFSNFQFDWMKVFRLLLALNKKKGHMWRFMFPFLVPALFSVLKQYSVRRSTFVSLSLFLCVYLCNYLFFFQTPITVVNLKKKMLSLLWQQTTLFNSIGAVHSSWCYINCSRLTANPGRTIPFPDDAYF